MKPISLRSALVRLKKLKAEFQDEVGERFEFRAKSCLTCEVKGSCCLDAHFVNVHVSRLEAVSIADRLDSLDDQRRTAVVERIDAAIERYELSESGDTFSQTFACPLFEKGEGCLVHESGKPLACITHACYELPEHKPPDEMLAERELAVDALNRRTYGSGYRWLPLPLAVRDELRRD